MLRACWLIAGHLLHFGTSTTLRQGCARGRGLASAIPVYSPGRGCEREGETKHAERRRHWAPSMKATRRGSSLGDSIPAPPGSFLAGFYGCDSSRPTNTSKFSRVWLLQRSRILQNKAARWSWSIKRCGRPMRQPRVTSDTPTDGSIFVSNSLLLTPAPPGLEFHGPCRIRPQAVRALRRPSTHYQVNEGAR